jgi:hypothetical protein
MEERRGEMRGEGDEEERSRVRGGEERLCGAAECQLLWLTGLWLICTLLAELEHACEVSVSVCVRVRVLIPFAK